MSSLEFVRRQREEPRVRAVVAIVAFAAVTVATVLVARPSMFSVRTLQEDEGYMLTILKSFVNHGGMYDDVFGQYGPFYYDVWGGFFSLFGIPLIPDAGRVVTLVVWVLTSLAFGLVTLRLTRSLLLGLAAQMAVFNSLIVLTNEPMHPVGLIALLLAALSGVACFVRKPISIAAATALGGVVGALLLVKVNIGIFALASLALACVVSYPALASRRWVRLPVEAGFVILPLLLMTSKFGEAWARHYAVHVAIAALAVVIVLRARVPGRRPTEELWWMLAGLAGVGLASCLAVIGSGTSLEGLFDGVIQQPLRQTDSFILPLAQSGRTWAFDLVALAGAGAFWYASRGARREFSSALVAAGSLLSILVGAGLALTVIGETVLFGSTDFAGHRMAFLGFAWVALAPGPGDRDPDISFARLLLPPLAVLQALHAFPVAGSQLMLGTFLAIPVGAICVANGVRGLIGVLEDERERHAALALGAVAGSALLLFTGNATLREPLRSARAAYDARVPLDLPGERKVRLPQEEVNLYRDISAAIERNCGSFLTLPGLNYFYIWTDQEPPTGYNATDWMNLFDDAHQRRVIEDTREIRGLCLLRNVGLAEGWSQGPIPPGPLVSYLDRGFRPLVAFGSYELLRREGVGSAP
ncbi:MAG TPA: hypothetical protein VNO20_03670 [Solirubrobacterales bacterium]|nr:hypothetical protein [Solirubrobacterales bacterium]